MIIDRIEQKRIKRQIRLADWRDYLGEHMFDILPTASNDPSLPTLPGGPLSVTYQWHRTAFYDDPDMDGKC